MHKDSRHKHSTQARKAGRPFFRKKAVVARSAKNPKKDVGQLRTKIHPQSDPYERQADRVADQVVSRKSAKVPLHKQITPLVQRKAEQPQLVPEEEYRGAAPEVQAKLEERQAEMSPVQEKMQQGATQAYTESQARSEAAVQTMPSMAPQTKVTDRESVQDKEEHQAKEQEETQFRPDPEQQRKQGPVGRFEALPRLLALAKHKGVPLPEPLKTALEQQFGADFSNVRIHTDVLAQRLSKALRAQAFATGEHIYFNAGRFDPNSRKGLHLLAHELAHTIQQGAVNIKEPDPQATATSYKIQAEDLPAAVAGTAADTASSGNEALVTTQNSQENKDAGEPEKGEAEGKEEGEKKEEKIEKAPTSPEEDPAYQETMGKVKQVRKRKQKHPSSDTKLGEVKDASYLPEQDQEKKNKRQAHMAEIDKAAEPKRDKNRPFTPETFKKLLNDQLEALKNKLPNSESSAKKFKRDKPLEQIKNNIRDKVVDKNKEIVQPLPEKVKTTEPSGKVEGTKTPKDLERDKTGRKPKPIDAKAASPKPKYDAEISMEKDSKQLDDLMTENEMTDQQLEKSKEPKFVRALDTKRKAQEEAKAVPGRYRQKEKEILANAQNKAQEEGDQGFQQMQQVRRGSFGKVHKEQGSKENAIEKEKTRIYKQFETIYNRSKKGVDDILEWVAKEVDSIFRTEVDKANQTFEKNVESKLDDIISWWDWLTGRDWDAINGVFRDEKNRFVTTMNGVLDRIANLIAKWLNHAIGWINWGQREMKRVFSGLSTKQQKLAGDALEVFNGQYEMLRQSVFDQEKEMATMLAESYKQNVDSLKATFDKIRIEVSKTWLDRAIEFVKNVAKAIWRLGKLLKKILSRVIHLVGEILADPIGFFENLASGVKKGFEKFKKNIDTYLISAFFDWLRGKVSGPGIKLPKKFDGSGLFYLVAQLLSIDYQGFREIATQVFGRKMVELFEKGIEKAGQGLGFAKKIFDLFLMIKNEGLGAVWQHIKQILLGRLNEIFEKVKEKVLYETIKKALIWVAGLFNPIGAFIKIVMLVYKAMKWLVDNIDRIETLVNAMIDSVALALRGNVGGIIEKVVMAIRTFIVMAIDFLAKILGLGSLAKKVRSIIEMLRKPIRKAIAWFLRKMKPTVMKVARSISKAARKGKALYTKGKEKVKGSVAKAKAKVINWWKARKVFRAKDGKSHTLYFKGKEQSATLMVASTARTYAGFIRAIQIAGKSDAFKTAKADALRIAKEIDKLLRRGVTNKEQADTVQQKLNELAKPTAILAAESPSEPPSVIKYGEVNNMAGGTKMEAVILSKKFKPGSVPRSNTPIWKMVKRRRTGSGSKSEFVQGHLLNHNIGGPGKAYNLAPITRTANKDHEKRVEDPVYNAVMAGDVVTYTVEVVYGKHGDRSYQKQLQDKGAARTNLEEKKLTVMNNEQKYMPTAFTWSWQLLKYNENKQKWEKKGKKNTGDPIESNLPDGNFKISRK